MNNMLRWYFIFMIVVMLAVTVTNVAVAFGSDSRIAFPDPINIVLKPNQTAKITCAVDDFVVTVLDDQHLEVLCRTYMLASP